MREAYAYKSFGPGCVMFDVVITAITCGARGGWTGLPKERLPLRSPWGVSGMAVPAPAALLACPLCVIVAVDLCASVFSLFALVAIEELVEICYIRLVSFG